VNSEGKLIACMIDKHQYGVTNKEKKQRAYTIYEAKNIKSDSYFGGNRE
jgi:hypothetical protein